MAIALLLAVLPHVAAQGAEAAQEESMSSEIALLTDMGLIIVAATILAFVAAGLKQPLIPAYIVAGIIIGPVGSQVLFGASLVTDPVFVRALSELGITFLLFTVGLELDLSRLKDVGRAAMLVGTAQVALTFMAGFLVATLLGFVSIDAVYLGLVLAFSSTMVVIKMISDNDEIETLHGRIMLGILLMQDIIVVVVLAILAAPNSGPLSLGLVADSMLKALGFFSLAIVLSKFVSPKVLKLVSHSVELVFLTALSFAFLFSLASHVFGFSTAIGGFLGGLSLAVFPYNLEVINRIKPLRDFFAIMFFVSLGMQFYPVADFAMLVIPIIVFTALVLLFKPLLITFLCILTGYERRTAFLSGIGLGQISEFSLILAMGLMAVNPASHVFAMTLIMAIVTIAVTPYLIGYGNMLYIPFSGLLQRFERFSLIKKDHELEHFPDRKMKNHIVVFGAHTMGMEVIETLQKLGKKFVVVDHNPEIIKKLIKRKIHCLYGDLEDMEVLEKVGLKDCKMVISTVPDEDDSMLLLQRTKGANPDAIVFVTAKTIEHAIKFYREGADFIIHLKLLGGKEASQRLEAALKEGKRGLLKKKLKEIELLEKKKRDELIGRIDKNVLNQIDELKAEQEVKKSESLGEE